MNRSENNVKDGAKEYAPIGSWKIKLRTVLRILVNQSVYVCEKWPLRTKD